MRNLFLGLLVVALASSWSFAQDEPRTYIAQFATNPPTIDGVLTSEQEWSLAESASGDWTLLGTTQADLTNNRFNVLWDETGMYVRHQVDHGDWPLPPIGSGFVNYSYENLQLFWDPNKDNETNANVGPDDTGIDGYVLAVNQPLGFSERSVENPQLAVATLAHIDGVIQYNFSGFSGIEIAQTTSASDVESYGYTEMFIPWEDFNFSDPAVEDTGLDHPYAPFDGEQWFFNAVRFQTDGANPAWVTTPDTVAPRDRPHGILQFSQGYVDGDVNGDGVCDVLDIDAVAKAVREQLTDVKYDVDRDGDIDWGDHEHMVEVIHNTYFGDSNLDLVFNADDIIQVFIADEYRDDIPLNSLWATGDWNGDGDFTSSDLIKVFRKDGYRKAPRDRISAVPEPSAVLLMVVGLLCLLRRPGV